MKRLALETYTDDELSYLVFNTEHLYFARRNDGFVDSLKNTFTFTDAQRAVLVADLAADLEEVS